MHIISKQGSTDNVLTYEHICDTSADMAKIDRKYITLGSVCIVLAGESGAMEVYMADSSKEWHDILAGASSGGSTPSGLTLHICTQNEVSNGKPNIEFPLETELYLVPSGAESGNLYDEYIWVNNAWELFGGAKVNLTGYATQEWVSQQGYLTNHQDISALALKSEIPTQVSALQNDSGYLTSFTETDPTVPAWAKASQKPTYTAQEVGALPADAQIPTIDASLTIEGAGADAKKTGDEISNLKSALVTFLNQLTLLVPDLAYSTPSHHGAAVIAAANAAIAAMSSASETDATLLSINAAYNSGDTIIRTSNELNDLKNYLTVTAVYDDASSSVLSAEDYVLSGTLALASGEYDVSTQTITVSYEDKTATFSIAVYNDITQSKVSLPSGYTQLAMIESTGSNCYIDTGILGSAVDHVEYGVQAMNGIGNGTNCHILSGSRTWYPYFRQGSSGARNFQGKNETTSGSATSISMTWEPNTNYIIQAYPTVVINGTTITTIASAGSADNVTLCVFARNGGSEILNYSKIRMFYIKMYDSQDQLTHYFIPCKDSSDVAGLYDTVGDAFFPSSGSAALVAGGEIA